MFSVSVLIGSFFCVKLVAKKRFSSQGGRPFLNCVFLSEFVDTKLMNRATYTLTGIEGPLVNQPGGLVFYEKVML